MRISVFDWNLMFVFSEFSFGFWKMGLDAIQVGAWNGKKKKEGEDEVTGCWMRFPFIGSCLSSKPKANGSRSGSATSTLYGKIILID